MKFTKSYSGFSAVELLIVFAIVGLLAVAGYTFFDRQGNTADNGGQTTSEQSAVANDVPEAPAIKSDEDLAAAEKTLDDMSVDGNGDSSQLDSELSAF